MYHVPQFPLAAKRLLLRRIALRLSCLLWRSELRLLLLADRLHERETLVGRNFTSSFLLRELGPRVVEQSFTRRTVDRLTIKQHFGHRMHLVGTLRENLVGGIVRLLHEARDFLVDSLGSFGRVILGVAIVAAQEHFVVRLAECLLAQRIRHAVVHDHLAGHLRGALSVRARDINNEMKLAAAYAIADLITDADRSEENIIPGAFDPRVAEAVAAAVAKAARETGVARL